MIHWLNQNSGAVQAVSAAILVIVTSVLVVATGLYAKFTKELSKAAAEQLEASRDIAEATMRPVISLWIEPIARAPDRWIACYKNIGNGPAINLVFHLPSGDHSRSRVGMSIDDPIAADIAFDLPVSPSEKKLSAEYQDASLVLWRTELTLTPTSTGYDNGTTIVRKIGKAT
jgi:hypothetical protein